MTDIATPDTAEPTVDAAAQTDVGDAITDRPDLPRNANTTRSLRTVEPHAQPGGVLGPLADLPGFWQGSGFSLIARPDFHPDNPDGFFLQLNLLQETIEFHPIGSPIPNRGSKQDDIALYGLTYLHRVTDAATGGALHIEPGIWLTVPETTEPPAPESVVRLSTVPHGNAVNATGFVVREEGTPQIPPANTTPFPIGEAPPPPGSPNPYRAYDLSFPTPFRTDPLPSTITQELVDNPNSMGVHALEGQVVNHVTHLFTGMKEPASVANIGFLSANAETVGLSSVFSVERIQGPDGTEVLQLQYSQTTLLNFQGMSWPHVTVGTLIRAF